MAAADRIETLLVEIREHADPALRERVDELIHVLVELYGDGLARIMEAAGDDATRLRLAGDPLVASLLVLHGLHPVDLETRVRAALGSAPVEVVGYDLESGMLRLRADRHLTLHESTTLEHALAEAAPELDHLELDEAAREERQLVQLRLRRAEAVP